MVICPSHQLSPSLATGSSAYSQPDIILIDGNILIFQLVAPDLAIIVVGSSENSTNPLLLSAVLTTVMEGLKAVIQ